ncbi:restriction endonuclease subunit S [Tetragenococcus halophilus]|uniref:restriction endonuclease subunit S n=1 Tax=Tetragenococcus halophilus TaxID=51669 RepID=UPI0030CB2402
MSKEEKRAPEVRFEGFYDDWKQRKLGELLKYEQPTKYMVKSTDYDDKFETPVLTAGQSFILGYTDETDGIKEASSDNPVIIFDDFTTSSHYVGFPFKVKSSAMKLLSLVSDVDDFYFVYNVLSNLNYTPQSHERHWISKFSEFNVFVPKHDEQKSIGTFFQQLDNLITLHQRKLEQLRELKKAALQYLFPKKDEAEPKVRFANFMDDRWSSYKIKDIFLERLEKSGEGELISVTINSGVVKASELDRKDNSSLNKTNYKSVKRHDIAYNSMRMWQGASGYSPYNGIVSPAYTVITPKQGINSKFFSFMFKKNEMIQAFKRNSQGLTSDTWNLKFPVLSSIKVKVPKTEEQDKIEQYMNNLDNIIKLYQGKLENFQDTKKAFLQKMFI